MVAKRSMIVIGVCSICQIQLTGCFDNPVGTNGESDVDKLFVGESDFQSGLLEWIFVENGKMASDNVSICRDAFLTAFGGYLYVLERYGADNVLKFDPSKNDRSGILYQKHLGDNWNPQDMEFVSDRKAYISNCDVPKITVFNPAKGTILSHIDISHYTVNPDHNTSPYAGDMQLVGDDLYVLLQRRDGFLPGDPTVLLKIDTFTDSITDTITFNYRNGFAMACHDGALYVTNPGDPYVTGDGGIEKVVLATKKVTTVLSEDELGGNPNQIVHRNGTLFYIVNYISWQNAKVVEVDMETGKVTTLPDVKDAYGGIYYDDIDELLYVGERDSLEMGVKLFKNNKLVAGPVTSKNSLPPMSMVVVR